MFGQISPPEKKKHAAKRTNAGLLGSEAQNGGLVMIGPPFWAPCGLCKSFFDPKKSYESTPTRSSQLGSAPWPRIAPTERAPKWSGAPLGSCDNLGTWAWAFEVEVRKYLEDCPTKWLTTLVLTYSPSMYRMTPLRGLANHGSYNQGY